MDFETYLIDKKIDPEAFKNSEPNKWQNFKALFDAIHPNSFTAQKKFLINGLRRLYHLKAVEPVKTAETTGQTENAEPKKPARPVVRRAPVVKKPDDNAPDA